jgi:DNA polymerase-4
VAVEYTGKRCWETGARLGCCQDTLTLLEVFDELWKSRPKLEPYWVSVTLLDLVPDQCVSLPLFREEKQRVELSRFMDQLNRKFGANTIYFGGMHEAQEAAPTRIAFTHIPDLDKELQ